MLFLEQLHDEIKIEIFDIKSTADPDNSTNDAINTESNVGDKTKNGIFSVVSIIHYSTTLRVTG